MGIRHLCFVAQVIVSIPVWAEGPHGAASRALSGGRRATHAIELPPALRAQSLTLPDAVRRAFRLDYGENTFLDPGLSGPLGVGGNPPQSVAEARAKVKSAIETQLAANPFDEASRNLAARAVATEFLNHHLLSTMSDLLNDANLLPNAVQDRIFEVTVPMLVHRALDAWMTREAIRDRSLRERIGKQLDQIVSDGRQYGLRLIAAAAPFPETLERPPHPDYTARWRNLQAAIAAAQVP